MKILHFADAHIDMAQQGRRDPISGLPLRVMDFLKALDTIVDAAIAERVDLVIFAGDAYKDRAPAPTFQREWGRRIYRLSEAGIPTILLVGNHDLSPATGRAHALQEFETLRVPHVHVISRPSLLMPEDLENLPLQIIGLPWISRSSFMAARGMSGTKTTEVFAEIEESVMELIKSFWERVDPSIPVIMTAHTSIQGAVYGGERTVMLGNDLVLSGGLVRDPRLSYVALGHIHKAQDLNEGSQPPVIYPGSIERVDFGEAGDEKYYVVAEVGMGQPTRVEWRKLDGRRFIDRFKRLSSAETFMEDALAALPEREELEGAVLRLILEYPREWEPLFDETALREAAATAFEFHLVRRPQIEARLRLPNDRTYSSLSAIELLAKYWEVVKTGPEEIEDLQHLAEELLKENEESPHG
jgi:DNA repair protein SbcD/Mre11